MACLATHVDLGPGGLEAVRSRVVIFPQHGRMAIRAHEVPILRWPCPVQLIVVRDLFLGMKMKPALATVRFWAAVPRNAERLKPETWQLNHILLQRLDAESVFDLVVAEFAVRSVGVDEKLTVTLEKR